MSRRLFLSSPLTRASHITRPATIRSPFLVAPFSSSSSSASTSTSSIPSAMEDTKPRFSAGTDEASAQVALAPLLQASSPSSSGGGAAGSGRWALVKDGEALERSFKFKTFAKTWDFMTAVSLQCKLKNHHPEWSNVRLLSPPTTLPACLPAHEAWLPVTRAHHGKSVYNTTFIRWTTHNPKGLSSKDVDLAAVCDALAKDFGELEPEPVSCEVRDVADRAVGSAGGECCVPPKK
ncbi:hypothetical protein Purlil1_11552 [Purpureocillium lilacinum]|uniref:4a-hydroxytetrahydrobiopterin dehydratase n=1 Tax=Purpureocillium lilacinum TaxID=33203 RepID=A0ABR0BJL5_PURLI|nr:hypothetical protein Purlil1_11552 [Purpureocillium lilacinum]